MEKAHVQHQQHQQLSYIIAAQQLAVVGFGLVNRHEFRPHRHGRRYCQSPEWLLVGFKQFSLQRARR
jgi:hypothetical protein